MKKLYTFCLISFSLFITLASGQSNCPNLCFTASTTNMCKGNSVTLTINSTDGTANRYDWNFGDGTPTYTTTVPTMTVVHTYTTAGSYSPWANVYTSGGAYIGYTYGSSGNIQVNGLTGISSPDSICPGDMGNFCINTNQGGNYSSFWKFGDGATYNSNQQCASHTYTTQTTYTMTAYSSINGCPQDSFKKSIIVHSNARPDANWWYNGSSPFCPTQPISFNTNPAASYTWNFGDGYTSNAQQPTHSYTATGTYSVTLSKTNICGKTKSYTNTITVSSTVTFPNQPWFYLSVNTSPTCPNSKVNFDAPWGYDDYEWNFGDGSPVLNTTTRNADHTYGSTLTTYTVSVKITNACGNDTTLYKTVQVVANAPFPNQSWFQINTNSPSCPNTDIHFDVPGGYVNYQWNYGDGSPLQNSTDNWGNHTYGTTLTTYTVSVKITNGCLNDTTLYTTMQIMNNVGFPNNSWFMINAASPSCINDPASFHVPGGYSSYLWSFGDGDSAYTSRDRASHTYTATGTYSVSVTITNGCGNDTTLYGTIAIDNTGTFPNWLDIETNPASTCPNDIVSFRLNTNNGYASYQWVFGDGDTLNTNGDQVQHSYTATGSYNVSCKITNGCGLTTTVYSSMNVSSTSPVNPGLTIMAIQSPSCPGDDVYFVPEEGQATYEYRWDFGDGVKDTTVGSGSTHAFATVGTKTVTVVIVNGCGSTQTVTLTHSVSATAVPSLTSSNGGEIWGYPGGEDGGSGQYAGCAGDAIIFYFMGDAANNVWHFGDGDSGTAVEHMLVSGGEGTNYPVTIIKHAYQSNGTYTVTLTLTNGCGNSTTGTLVINIGGNLQVAGEMTTSPPPFTTCAPIDFLGFGGADYDWDFGDGTTLQTSSPTVSHTFSSQGVYVVSVVITNGCGNSETYSKSINVDGVGGPAVALNSSSNPTCVGGSNGTASVNVSGGDLPYTYQWSHNPVQTTSSASGLSAGLYYVLVTDNNGCSSNFGVSINNPAPIVLAPSSVNSACGIPNGSASISITSGGTSPFTYTWSNGATASSASGLGWGQYSVTVTDNNGCTAAANVSVSENNGASVTTNTITNISCYGSSTGAININVSGGTAPYTYAWSNSATTQDITGLAAGNYSVMVTDAGGCNATYNASVTQNAQLVVTTSIPKAPTCGKFDGSAMAGVSGGTGPYTYAWDANTGNQTTQTATGLPAGSYTVTVTDASGCSKDGFASLSNSNAPNISATITHVSCFGGANGGVDLTITGGTGPFGYNWSTGANTQDVTGLVAATYFVSVNDAMQCQSYRLYTITQPQVLAATATNTGVTCGNTDGTATALPTGGTAPYSYLWTGGQTTSTATGLSAGSKTVTVTDSKGCTTAATTSLTATVIVREICMVTVDSTSTKNVIVWEKPSVTNIDSFRIYRDIATVYTRVGAVDFSAPSQFIDNTNGVNPNITSYRYKISALDNCGMESAMSAFHKTIHLQISPAVPSGYQLNWDDYLGLPVTQYRILRDTFNLGNWTAIDSVPFGITSYTDVIPWDSVGYLIEMDHPTGCVISGINPDPEATNLNSSRSNAFRMTGTATHAGADGGELFAYLYPNPSNGYFTVDIKNTTGTLYDIHIYNIMGEEVRSLHTYGKSRLSVDLSKESKGVYFIKIVSSERTITKKIIIE